MSWLEQAADWLRELLIRQQWLEFAHPAIERTPDVGLLAAAAGALTLLLLLLFMLTRSRRMQEQPIIVAHDDPPWVKRAPAKSWDVFISYKSENVELARLIADRLIASGRNVWFAEYQVLLAARDRFQEAIDGGLEASRYGIALTNDLYADSEHCRREMEQLIGRCGPERIVEVRTPAEPRTRQLFPVLEHGRAIAYEDNVEAVLAHIGAVTGWRIAAAAPPPARAQHVSHAGECLDIPYTLSVAGWKLVDPHFQGGGPCYGLKEPKLLWNLQTGAEHSTALYDARRRWTKTRINDRELFDSMCDYARSHLDTPIGVHLFFLDGFSHFAASYQRGKYWKRRYSVMLVEPQTYKAAEFLFTFQFEGSFADYCRNVDLMDAVVKSLKWGPPRSGRIAQPSQAEQRIGRVLDDMPAANKLVDEGMALATKGKYADGIALLERALSYSIPVEMQGFVHYNLGLAHERNRNLDAAVRSYQASIAAHPGQFNALCNLGKIIYGAGDIRTALDYFLEAAKVNSEDYIATHNVAVCYEDLKDVENARAWMAKARQLKR